MYKYTVPSQLSQNSKLTFPPASCIAPLRHPQLNKSKAELLSPSKLLPQLKPDPPPVLPT